MENKKIKIIAVIIGGLFLLFFIFYSKIISPPVTSFPPASQGEALRAGKTDIFYNLNLEAKAVLVFDLTINKPIFELNSDAQLPLASLTKIMTVVIAEEIKKEDISGLVETALAQSSNQSASALASMNSSFIDLMNKKAEELKLNQTYFLNETGLDISKELSGAHGSANDVVKLVSYALNNNPDLFEITTNNFVVNTNPYASSTTLLIASKTGLTDLAGGNLAIVFDAGFNHPVASVVLGSSEQGRFTDTQKLIKATFKYLINKHEARNPKHETNSNE